MSLRARLVALAVGSALAVLLLLAVPVVVTVQDAVEDDREQEAATLVQGVADVLSTGATSVADLGAIVDRGRGRRGDDGVSVVLADGSRLGEPPDGCTSAAAVPDPQGRDDELLPVSPVTTTGVGGGTLVAVAAETPDGVATVCSLIPDDEVREDVIERLGPLGLGGGAVLVVVAGLAVLVARRVARHLEDAALTADSLAAGDLEARAVPAGPPEVRSVAIALNRLAARIDELLTLERETVADLSHRLRTPLTAVRLDVEALPDSPAREELDEHVAQLERTLTAVIQAARRPQREGAAPSCDAREVVRDRFAFWSPLLEDQGREVSLVVDLGASVVPVRAAREDLTAALDALLENAVAHTDEGIPVAVEVAGQADGVRVEVRDQGAGVPPEALVRGRSDRGSSGLGLDIARGCAEASGGRLELDRDGSWHIVRLVLGRA